MTHTIHITALAEEPPRAEPPAPTIEDILQLVDELANVCTPAVRSSVVRIGLITELRNELHPSLGSTSRGRGSGNRLGIDIGTFTLWEDVTGRIQGLIEELGDRPTTGRSLEQALNAWARDLVATDVDARTRQEHAGLPVEGLNTDARHTLQQRLARIRDLIEDHFDPAPHGDIPGAACPVCLATEATVDDNGTPAVMPALGWRNPRRGITVECRNPDCGARWTGYEQLLALRTQVDIARYLGNQR